MSHHNRASIRPVVLQILELVRTGQLSSRAAAPLVRALSESQDDGGAAVSQPVAIIGLGGSFPGSSDIASFWKALRNGADAVTEIPLQRWDWRSVFSEQIQAGKTYSRWGGFLQDVQQFDPLFFNISPREALAMDPQQRLFLQAAWHALEDGGYADLGSARQRCGVFTGCRDGDYRNLLGDAKLDSYAAIGCDTAILSARIAYLLDLAGPAITIDSACSSSLSAVALACTSLQAGLCDYALAGGVSVLCTPELHISLGQTGMLSRSGRCRPFDADADGFVPAEGVGVALLKPLSAALDNGDHIYAVIEAWGMNQDGRTNGITAPSGAAQADLLTETYRRFGVSPQSIGYIETHGTGTQLGDPIELEGLQAAFRRFTSKSHFCAIGSVKSNIGHALAASGIAGLIKAVGSLQFQEIYPSNHYRKGNLHFDLSDTPFWVNTELRHWESTSGGTPRRAAVSSFGFSGTNAHVVLREAPLQAQSPLEGPWLFPFSGRTLTALETQLRQTNTWLEQEKPSLANLSYTLIKGRSMFEERTAVMAASHQELASKINLCLSKPSAAALPADAQLWLKGDRTACVSRASELRRQGAAHIIAPLYPFEKQSFWPVDINNSIPDSNFRVDGRESFLTDHLIHGRPTVPGVVLLCLAYRSLPVGYQLRDFTWTRPLVWSGQAIDLAVRWRHVSQTYEFTIESKEGTHASGRASRPFTSNFPDHVDLETLKGRLNSPLTASDVYARFSKLGFNYGPTLQGIVELRTGSTEAFALLRSPISEEKAPLQFPFSIGILDGAIQTLLGLQVSGVAWTPIPFSVREFLVHRAIGDQCYVWLRLTGQGTDWLRFDIDFLDQTGNVLAQLREFTVRPLAGQQVTFPAVSKNSVQTLLIRTLAREVGLEESQISVRESFSRYGIDSMMVLNMTRELESTFSELPKTLFFEFNSIAALADHLSAQFPNVLATGAEAPQSTPLPVKASSREEVIAIVGISGRFPEAANLDEFWENLRAGRDCIREIPLSRWDHSRYFASDRGQVGKTCSRWGGFLNQVEYFDPLLFRISPREAEVMDPQERLFLEVVWETIENAGYTPADFSNQTVGVYAGAMYTQYQLYGAEAGALGTPLALTSSQAAIANRVSYFFDFQGPSIGLDTMCSSSLTA
ncbi:MAG: polyketide synthase dehydratase domain-containing protein, partial [Acidobacteriaceae bacterium]|nr:polyketide synthase dehydratase domain-containing protein [Acidobacteriaceae bacterium]